jgi:hypothetical protein
LRRSSQRKHPARKVEILSKKVCTLLLPVTKTKLSNIKRILKERECDEHKLARELDCTSVQIRNLRDGKSKLPNSHTCRKIFRYCDKYSIDYSFIDWNDIAYTLFIDQDRISEYTWLEDLDKSNYILLKHNECGKKTKVPFSTFNIPRTTPCIHCWVK